MKYLITLISLVYSMNCLSQTINADLFQTWYLYDIWSSDTDEHFPVSAVTPSISPNITFKETTLDFYGEGACNSFTGTFSFPFDNNLLFNNFASTLLLCDSPSQISYEGSFFDMLHYERQYFISGEGDNMTLVISTAIFANYVFRNYQLNSPSFDLKQTVIYPNPVNSILFIESQNSPIDKIEIFNSLGQSVQSLYIGCEVINVSDLAAGIYFIKLHSNGKTVCKKIIKS